MKKIIAMILMVATLVTCCAFGFTACNKEEGDKVKVFDTIELTSEEYAYLLQKGNTTLQTQVNDLLSELKTSGELDKIINKYFNGEATFEYENPASKDGCFVVATNAYFPPFEYHNGSKITGVDMEIASLLAAKLGKTLYILDEEFDSVFTSVANGEADIGMAGITKNATRMQSYDFSDAYYTSAQVIVVAADDTTFDNCKTAADIEKILSEKDKSYVVGTQQATTGYMYTAGDVDFGYDGFKNLTTTAYSNGALAIKDIINGKVNAVIIDKQPAIMIAKSYNN